MKTREPAGWERDKGKSAELFAQAWTRGGTAGNTCGTVRGRDAAGALSAESCTPCFHMGGQSVEACLYRFFHSKTEKWRAHT